MKSDHEKKSDSVIVHHERKSNGARVHHQIERCRSDDISERRLLLESGMFFRIDGG